MTSLRKLAFALAAGVLVTSCASTRALLEQQQLSLLRSQVARTDDALTALSNTPDPEAGSHFSVLLPATMLNAVLQGFDDTIIDPPDPKLKDLRVIVSRVRTQFDAALPYVETSLTACRRPMAAVGCGDLSATLKATTFLDFAVAAGANGGAPTATLTVQLVDVVPSVQVKWWQLRLHGFVRRVIKAQLAKVIADRLPAMTVPLQTKVGFNFPAGNYRTVIPAPRPGSRIDAVISTPGLAKSVALKVNQALFLKDGVHLFLQVE